MRYSTGLCATLAASAAQAFLLPSSIEDGFVMPNLLDAVGPLEHLVPVPCFDCLFLKPGETEAVQTKGAETVLIYNITTSEDRREILLNGFPVYPQVLPDGNVGAIFLPQLPKPHRHVDMPESFHGLTEVGLGLETDNARITPSSIEITGWNVQRLTIQLTRPFPSQIYNVPEFMVDFGEAIDAEGVEAGQIMILDTSYGFNGADEPAVPTQPVLDEEHCNTLCQWQQTISAKLAELKTRIKSHMRPHGCGGRKKGHNSDMPKGDIPQDDMPAHEMRPHRRPPGFTAPEFKNRHDPPPPGMRHHGEELDERPHHRGHHGHHEGHHGGHHGGHRGHHGHHGHKSHGPMHRARRVAMAIIIPVVLGFAVGLATYMLGYAMGAFVAFVMSRFGCAQRGYEIIDEEEDVEGGEKVDDDEKVQLAYSDDVEEEEVLPVYVEVESQK